MTDADAPIPMDESEQGPPTAAESMADPATEAARAQTTDAAPSDAPGDASADGATDAAPDDGGGADAQQPLPEPAEDPRSREELLAELTAAETARDDYLDDLRRARAEFENFRKRTTRESAAQRELGKGDVASALLEVLDDLDRTLQAAEQSSDDSLAKGVQLVADKLVHALRGLGLERLEATGVAFDPNQHEAVSQQPAAEPVDQPIVAQVFRPGYRLGERVLRPAMVVVEQ
ncbi:nucleotide exchange factor GrpE [Egicoccus halophilus]|uniref:Protein GrpE n=1 Tax=Egicoccus halophilus TaxID=1670830 RepID=A0A8J3A737_9ACTN|nr:nucleotide exchange factor GrpE [Egicoccus halophilus]GGI03331.1 protein GrpE [Egicoccus halophilus]